MNGACLRPLPCSQSNNVSHRAQHQRHIHACRSQEGALVLCPNATLCKQVVAVADSLAAPTALRCCGLHMWRRHGRRRCRRPISPVRVTLNLKTRTLKPIGDGAYHKGQLISITRALWAAGDAAFPERQPVAIAAAFGPSQDLTKPYCSKCSILPQR